MKNNRYWSIIGSTALVATTLLVGCSHAEKKQAVESQPAVAQDVPPTPAAESKPGGIEGELIVVNAVVKSIDKKSRTVELKFEDGKVKKIKCGPEVRNFPQIRVGDNVKAQFLESVELEVQGPGAKPTAEHESELARAPLGSKPGFAAINAVEVSATVQSIDYKTRDVTLLVPEGKTFKLKAGPEVKRFNEVKQGDTMVARLTKAVSVTVSAPEKKQ